MASRHWNCVFDHVRAVIALFQRLAPSPIGIDNYYEAVSRLRNWSEVPLSDRTIVAVCNESMSLCLRRYDSEDSASA